MALGPVDVYIIGFPGNNFTGQVAPAILEQMENGTIRLLDVLLVIKSPEGSITAFELADLVEGVGPDMTGLELGQPGALGKDDAEVVADELPNGSSAPLAMRAASALWTALPHWRLSPSSSLKSRWISTCQCRLGHVSKFFRRE